MTPTTRKLVREALEFYGKTLGGERGDLARAAYYALDADTEQGERPPAPIPDPHLADRPHGADGSASDKPGADQGGRWIPVGEREMPERGQVFFAARGPLPGDIPFDYGLGQVIDGRLQWVEMVSSINGDAITHWMMLPAPPDAAAPAPAPAAEDKGGT